MKRIAWCLFGLALLSGPAAPAAAQSPQSGLDWDPGAAEMGRTELRALAERLEAAAVSPGYSAAIRKQAKEEVAFIRERLEEGDFQVGDRVVLSVQGNSVLSDTLSVQPGRVLVLPQIGDVPLTGVLRSELQGYLSEQLAHYVQDATVRTQTLIRLAVLGEVARQGFYAVPAEGLVDDAIMVAGGPAPAADLDRVEIRRGERVLWAGEPLQQAIIAGFTLDQLNLRAGDRIVVPTREQGIFSGGVLRGLLVALPSVALLVSRLF